MREEDSKLFSIIEILEYIQLFNFKILTDKILTDKILKNANGCKNFLVQKKWVCLTVSLDITIIES